VGRRFQLLVCDGPSCGVTHDSACLKERIERRLAADPALRDRVAVVDFTCFGRCDDGPNMLVHELADGQDPWDPPDLDALCAERGFYTGMNEARVDRMVDLHLAGGEPVDDLAEEY
jgi:(2Fe-2S) ferredoxin